MKNSYSKELSFVIIGKDAEWCITRVLDSVMACTPEGIASEVIYVDSASTDRTIEIASHYPVKIVRLSSDDLLCASAGRFIGSQYASGRYIAFIDSDMEFLEGWLPDALAVMNEREDIGAISGIITDVNRSVAPNLPSDSTGHNGAITELQYVGNAAMFRHSTLEAAGTWNPYIISDEEPELCLRIRHAGYRIVQLAVPISLHYTYPVDRISTLLSRRRRRLFLGYGQVMRYHLHTGLLLPYVKERGWVVAPALAGLAAIAAGVAALLSGNVLWTVGLVCALLLVFAADAVRSRSLYKAVFHVLHRALILEGAVRGFFMHPHAPDEYPQDVRKVSASPDSIDPAMSAQTTFR